MMEHKTVEGWRGAGQILPTKLDGLARKDGAGNKLDITMIFRGIPDAKAVKPEVDSLLLRL